MDTTTHEERGEHDGFIATPWFDIAFFILSPLVALLLGQLVVHFEMRRHLVTVGPITMGTTSLVLRALIHAHLVAVLVRSHGNRKIFAQFRARFIAVPVVLLSLAIAFDWVLAALIVVTTFWDVYHSSMQTFGLGRIYDSLRGNSPTVGRTWDMGFNHVIYVIPHLVGPLLPTLLGMFTTFRALGYLHFETVPSLVVAAMEVLRPWILGASGLFMIAYIAAWARLVRMGYQLSQQKLLLFFTTAIAAIAAAGFDIVGQGLLVLNVFHAVQYIALVWWVEGGRFTERVRLDGIRGGRSVALVLMLVVILAYGVFIGALPALSGNTMVTRVFLSVNNVIAFLHFWYDGFVWSVRKKEAVA